MRKVKPRNRAFGLLTLAMTFLFAIYFDNKGTPKMDALHLPPQLMPLFAKTRQMCFGRYILDVPEEAQIIWGRASFPSKVESFKNTEVAIDDKIKNDLAEFKSKEETFEVSYNDIGPIPDSWQIRYYEDVYSKQSDLFLFKTYVSKGDRTFILNSSVREGESESDASIREKLRASSLRLRSIDEIPTGPGFCIEHGFFESQKSDDQEIVDVGIFFPSHPDVSMSFSSNKDAYADYDLAEFKKLRNEELSLLARIDNAKKEQGRNYPERIVLREGRRTLQKWDGEESLIRRNDGTHDFEWAFVGTPKDVSKPAEMNIKMYTKVKYNTVGAASRASLNDEEAIALFDKISGSFRYRVVAPSGH